MFWGVMRAFEHSFVVMRIFLFISAICFIPRLFLSMNKSFFVNVHLSSSATLSSYTLGIENVTREHIMQLLPATACKVGLLATKQEQGLTSLAMLHSKGIDVDCVMYLDDFKNKVIPDKDVFSGLDLLLIDVVNVDCVYNQEVLLLFNSLMQGAACGKHLVILDRPNMVGGEIEGPIYCFGSEHKYIKLPLYHGMTVGELAQYYNNQALRGAAKIHVVSMRDYHRAHISTLQAMRSDNVGNNLCKLLACIEPIDVGLESTYPYKSILLPETIPFSEQQWHRLQAILKELGINSMFLCDINQQTNDVYRGLCFSELQASRIDIFKAVLSIIDFFKSTGLQLSFSDNSCSNKVGVSLIKQYVKGVISKERCIFAHNEELKAYYRAAFGVCMYYPLPQLHQ